MLLHPGLVNRAVLLRPAMVLDTVPETDLTGTSALILLGQTDAFRAQGEKLAEALRARGPEVDERMLAAGHGLSAADAPAIAEWLTSQAAFGPT